MKENTRNIAVGLTVITALALLGGSLVDAPLEDLGIHPDGFAPE